jgi:hypothetical protein
LLHQITLPRASQRFIPKRFSVNSPIRVIEDNLIMDINTINGFGRQLTFTYFLIALNVFSAIFFVIFSAVVFDIKLRLYHAAFHSMVDVLNIIMLVYLQPWRIIGALRKGLEYKRRFEAISDKKDASVST